MAPSHGADLRAGLALADAALAAQEYPAAYAARTTASTCATASASTTRAQLDAATAQTRGAFSKWNVNASPLQRLGARTTLHLHAGGQGANTSLDSAEKMTVDGPYTVRAYDIGAVSGDTGTPRRSNYGTMLPRSSAAACRRPPSSTARA
jgi:hemolysin activation/secretion protein